MSADEKHSGGGNIAFNFKVSMLASDKGISLLTLLMVSVVMGLVFAIDGSQISKDILNGVCCRTIYIGRKSYHRMQFRIVISIIYIGWK